VVKKLGILAAGLGAAALFSTATAQADTHIYVGGNGDCDSSQFVNGEKAAGQYDPKANNIAITYPVACPGTPILFVDPAYNDRIQGAVAEAQKTWDANCTNPLQHCTLEGVSLGSGVVSIVGTNVNADGPSSNTHVITDANPWGAPGFAGANRGVLLDAVDAVIGFPTDIPQVAGSESRLELGDFISDGAQQSLPVQINMYLQLGTNHTLPIGAPNNTFMTSDGVTQEVFEQGTPIDGVINPADNPAIG
jgi:hypothetical protein